MPKPTLVLPEHMQMFEEALHRKTADQVEGVAGDLQDLYIWDDTGIRVGEIPKIVPGPVREQIMALHKQQMEFGKQVDKILEELFQKADLIGTRKTKDEEKQKPHCKCCGQVVKPKPVGRKS